MRMCQGANDTDVLAEQIVLQTQVCGGVLYAFGHDTHWQSALLLTATLSFLQSSQKQEQTNYGADTALIESSIHTCNCDPSCGP